MIKCRYNASTKNITIMIQYGFPDDSFRGLSSMSSESQPSVGLSFVLFY